MFAINGVFVPGKVLLSSNGVKMRNGDLVVNRCL